ncbi:MAG: hypothetical protein WC088_01025 [Candidatus Izemoplasmatales bacterium]|jgi:hypothetical protein|nr:hypothetical protein [Candidatus Izemoplasmatales bacterium]MDD4595540.1 hypothetical protein [Candidatus Izemoplasmatales bacterium]
MNKIKKFVTNLLKDYFSEQDKKELISIMTTSLEEKVEDLVEQGTPVDKAIEQSINEFGSTDDVLEAFPKKDIDYQQKIVKTRKHQFWYSILGYTLIVGLALFFNLTFIAVFRSVYWFIVVAIGMVFWPGTMFFRYREVKK